MKVGWRHSTQHLVQPVLPRRAELCRSQPHRRFHQGIDLPQQRPGRASTPSSMPSAAAYSAMPIRSRSIRSCSRCWGWTKVALGDLPRTGLSADYVRREVKRAVVGSEGRGIDLRRHRCRHSGWSARRHRPFQRPAPGDIADDRCRHDNVGPDLMRTTPERVKAAVLAAFEGGAGGIVLEPEIFGDAARQPDRASAQRWPNR